PRAVVEVAAEVAEGSRLRLVIDLSTTGPSATREVEALLSARRIALLGAPVSGGTVAAERGTLAVMPSGPESAYREVEALQHVLGKNVFYLGADPTLGQTMKIINNTLYAASLVAASEALVYGVKAGLDPQTMLDVL